MQESTERDLSLEAYLADCKVHFNEDEIELYATAYGHAVTILDDYKNWQLNRDNWLLCLVEVTKMEN